MAFYYISLFSVIPLGIAYVVMALLYWFVWRVSSGEKRRFLIRTMAAAALLLLPVSEELWIAWNFARACENAGKFINEKVAVDGFYDDTRSTHAGEPTEQAAKAFDQSGYRFLEMKGPKGGVVHIEKVDDRWRATLIDRPTAKYHYKQPYAHVQLAHKVRKNERQVVDSTTNEVLARETNIARDAPWFYIGLDAPVKLCYGQVEPELRGSIYTHALLPNRGGR